MPNGSSALEQDFLGQLMLALGQRTNFNQDLTDKLSAAEGRFDQPSQFEDVFDLDERARLQGQERDIFNQSINTIQNQLAQRKQSFGSFAESVNRGMQSARQQANLDRQFGLDEQRLALERQRAGAGGLTEDQLADNQRADLSLALAIEKFEQGRVTGGQKTKSSAIANAQKARLNDVPERQIVQALKAAGITQKDFTSGVGFITREIKRMNRSGATLEEVQEFIINNGYSPGRFNVPEQEASKGIIEQIFGQNIFGRG